MVRYPIPLTWELRLLLLSADFATHLRDPFAIIGLDQAHTTPDSLGHRLIATISHHRYRIHLS